ncbi:MAG TPA: phosphotransferase [Thermomicrobiaceae bacterium]|nr:phosphotransferase [Thermomicrobiaceae bacterium]
MRNPLETIVHSVVRRLSPDAEAITVLDDQTLDGRELWHVRALRVEWRSDGRTCRRSFVVKREIEVEGGESAVLSALADTGLPIPTVLYTESDELANYLVMDVLPGSALFPVIQSSDARWEIAAAATAYAGTLARIHGLDWRALVPWMSDPAGPETEIVLGQIQGMWSHWDERIRQAPDSLKPLFDSAQEWLSRHMIETASLCLCHGDYTPANLLVEEGEISGVVDWDRAQVSDPAWDLALLPFAVYRSGMPAEDADLFVQTALGAYGEASPHSWQNLPFFIIARLLDGALDALVTGDGEPGLIAPTDPTLDDYVHALERALPRGGQLPWQQ